jgi:hypothetical protein
MAIIYSYPTVTPEKTDLVLGTDVSVPGKPTKNFTVQSIIDLVTTATGDLQFVLNLGNTATGVDINLTNNSFRGGGFITTGGVTVSGTTGTGFTNITSTEFTGTIATAAQPNITSLGTLSALVISGPISGTGLITNSNLTGAQNDNVVSTLAIKTYVDNKVGLYDTLQEVLANGNTTGGSDIVVSAGDDVTFTNTSKILMGTTAVDNFEIYSDSANSIVIDRSPGALKLQTSLLSVRNEGDTTQTISASAAGAVELYHAGDKKIETLAGGAKVTGAFQATTSGTFASLVNTGTYTDSSGDVGTAGQLLSSTGSGTNWVTEVPLYNWIIEADSGTGSPYTVVSGNTIDFVGGDNINTSWINASKELKIDVTGVVQKGTGAATQVAYWTDADTIAGDAGMIYDAANDYLTLAGTIKSGTFTTTAGTATWSTTVMAGFTSITSTTFIGALTGNASTATALAASGAIALTGDTTSTGGPYTYTSGGALSIATTIADTTVTGKVLTNLPTPSSAAIAASDTILAAMAKLQGQITGIPQGLVYKGTWNASTNTPTLASGTGTTGEFYIVSVAGTTNLDGITDWQVGDWAIFVEVGATDTWQKIDNTSAILGSGTANKIAKWTGSNTLATGLIADDGTTVTVGNSGNLVVEGNTTLGNADTDTTTVKGPAVFEETVRINEGISLGANTYGTAGQVLTSGGGSSSVNTWTTPTTGTVTSVTAGTGITIGGTAAAPTVAIDYLGTDNAILSAPQENAIATTDTVWFSDATDNNIKKTTVANLIALDPARSLSAVLAIGNTSGANNILMADSQAVKFGAGNDLSIQHNGTDSQITNLTGNLQFTQLQDDGDISFASDDGSGGDTIYFKCKGDESITQFIKNTNHQDNTQATFGTGLDLSIYHNGTTNNSNIDNATGDLYFTQNTDDGDIIFRNDNGSGGVTEYLRLDGGITSLVASKDLLMAVDGNGGKIKFGASQDLQIYHDGSNSKITEGGTGGLYIGSSLLGIESGNHGETMAQFLEDGPVKLYYDNVQKFQTTSTGIEVSGTSSTFSGAISAAGTITVATHGLLSITGGNNLTLSGTAANHSGLIFATNSILPAVVSADTNGVVDLGQSGNSFKDLYLSGNIIPGGGGGGTAKGGHFSKLYTTGAIGANGIAFTITRATGAAMIFDVMFTGGGTGSGSSTCKKYTVAKKYGTAIGSIYYNKIIDTGPALGGSGTADYNIVFDVSGSSGDAIECNITPVGVANQEIGITIDLGFGAQNAVVVMN